MTSPTIHPTQPPVAFGSRRLVGANVGCKENMRITPTKQQWAGWSLPSKATYVAAWLAVASILLAIVPLILPENGTETKIDAKQNAVAQAPVQSPGTIMQNMSDSPGGTQVAGDYVIQPVQKDISDISFNMVLAFHTAKTGNFVYDNDSGVIVISSGGIHLIAQTLSGKRVRYSNVYPDGRYWNENGTIKFSIPFELTKGQDIQGVEYTDIRDNAIVQFDMQTEAIVIFGGGRAGGGWETARLNGLRGVRLACYENAQPLFDWGRSFSLKEGTIPTVLSVTKDGGKLNLADTSESIPLNSMAVDEQK